MFAEDVRCFAGNNQKVAVCHNGNKICVDESAVSAHIAHGDYLGYCSARVSTADEKSPIDISLFPNPATNTVSLHFEGLEGHVRVNIFNPFGMLVNTMEVELNIEDIAIDISSLTSGIYTVNVIHEEKTLAKKLIIH
jgi:hypothetical protein